ncbi:hypothetical protein NKH77_22190 [Streptomyces sp. M19]
MSNQRKRVGEVARRPVAVVAAVVLMLEAVGIALLNWILGLVVDRQEMSLAGLDSDAMTVSTWIAGGVFGLYLLGCGLVSLRCAVTDRPPRGFFRILLITCAVVHGLLGAFCVGLVGWLAFAFMMVVLGLIVLTLMGYYETEPAAPAPSAEDDGGSGPAGDPTRPDRGSGPGLIRVPASRRILRTSAATALRPTGR